MSRYRILTEYPNKYIVQERFLFFWVQIIIEKGCMSLKAKFNTLEEAKKALNLYKDSGKIIHEE